VVCTVSRAARKRPVPKWHSVLLAVLPAVQQHARITFRNLDPEAKAEAVQNAVCMACSAVARLAELNKLSLVYPTVVARFAVAQTKDNRMLGRPLNCKDISSPYCQRQKGIVVERLDRYDTDEDTWKEIVIEDRRAGPAEIVRVRWDFSDWLKTLSRRDRRVASFLALGNHTGDAARRFGVSEGRVSQLRRELAESWRKFTGEAEDGRPAAA